ncbi:hypothetical protein [Ornithinimicrobium cryptoxanthini]|uniref:Uncharacterized protein n=1 Tax=Ornithinimicrobium cryptoxanthini TaxID=2934161 RepID=A0ABY4YE30_9MICO|nr:hypothetical protein [Ornithinimicrobium cryptoxanthini]USQ75041.1 hypothetical protein NF557_10295 [Ornithinimicrobium cryptoxanthini]
MSSVSTLEDVPEAGSRRSLLWRRTGVVALTLLVAGGLLGFFGDRQDVVEGDSGESIHLAVTYPSVSRPGQDVPFEIEVTDPAGLDQEVTLALDADYLDIYETQAWYPAATDETRDGEWLYLTFGTEGRTTMVIGFDAYIQPDQVRGREGRVAVVEDGVPGRPVTFKTTLFP